jgi:hypothetical protein
MSSLGDTQVLQTIHSHTAILALRHNVGHLIQADLFDRLRDLPLVAV